MHLIGHVGQLISHWGLYAVFFVVLAESAGVPLPGETALVTAAIFAGQGKLSLPAVIATATAAAVLGDNVGYWIGREFGFPLVLRYGGRIGLDEPRLKLGQYMFRKHGGKIVFFGRFVAILRTFAALLAGINRLPWPEFLVFNALGGVTWATLFATGGYMLGKAFEHYARPVGIAALLLAVVGAFVVQRYLKAHADALMEEAQRAMPGPLVAPKAGE